MGMTAADKARKIITEALPHCKGKPFATVASIIIDALYAERVGFESFRVSPEFFVRFHAHCSFLGKEGGEGYEYWYNAAISYAMALEDWPTKIVARTIRIPSVEIVDGQKKVTMVETMQDFRIPESTKKANNRQMMLAYQVIQDGAKEKGLILPEEQKEGIDGNE